jgi:hypothetical protein
VSYTLETLDEGHIILLTLNADFDMAAEMIQSSRETFDLLEAGPDHIVFISDGRELQTNTLNDILQGANAVRSPETKAVMNHPKRLTSLSVTSSKLLQLAVKGLNSATFGFMEVTIFDSMEEVLAEAQRIIAEAEATVA